MVDKGEDGNIPENETLMLIVKSATRKEEIEVSINSTIAQFKELIADKFNVDVQSLRLIYAGRILKDTDTIRYLSIKNGYTICIAIKPSTQTTNSSPNYETLSTASNVRNIFSQNLMQHYADSSNILRSMLNTNPAIQQIIQRNPEVGHVINNPALLRQAMEVMRNPNLANEFRRTADRAMSNIESLPGGFNALQQMYYDIEEPLMTATSDRTNPFATLISASSSNQQGTENREPLPNPWSSSEPVQNQPNSDMAPLTQSMLERLQNPVQLENSSQILQQMYSFLSNESPTNREELVNLQQQLQNASIASNEQSGITNNISPELIDSLMLPAYVLANIIRDQPPVSDTSNNNAANSSITNLLTQLNLQGMPNNSVQFEERYRSQMQQLTEMGFGNPEANLQALIAAFGDLNGAIERLLSRNLTS